jgi:membrane peptidoglycan carboxypeptidase
MVLATEIFDRHGEKIGELAEERRYYIKAQELPPHVIDAFLSAEDRHFFTHHGVHWRSILRAFLKNTLRGSRVQGASTISQQVVRTRFLDREKTLNRKMKEIILALVLEKHHSKDQILDLYLNQIYFGNRSYGIESAARNYFRKSARNLTLGEAALLAAIPKSPSLYAPHKNRKKALKRQKWILNQMVAAQKITAEAATKAHEEPLKIYPEPEDHWQKAPYFVASVTEEINNILDSSETRRQGLKIHTTLDGPWQTAIQNSVGYQLKQANLAREISQLDLGTTVPSHTIHGGLGTPIGQKSSPSKLNSGPRSIPQSDRIQGAVILLDSRTGAIRGMQGGSDFETTQFNRSLHTSRSLGTLVVPFYIAVALEQGLTPLSPIDEDLASRILRDTEKSSTVSSFNNNQNQSPLLVELFGRDLKSLTPLVLNIGQGTVLEKINKLGLKTLENRSPKINYERLYGARGTPLDVAKAFAALTHGGEYIPHYLIESISTSDGRTIYQAPPEKYGKSIFSQDISQVMAYFISSPHSPLSLENTPGTPAGYVSAVTSDLKDSWAVGAFDDITAVFWMGSERGNRPIGKSSQDIENHVFHAMNMIKSHTQKVENRASPHRSFSSQLWQLVDVPHQIGLKLPMPRPKIVNKKAPPFSTRDKIHF